MGFFFHPHCFHHMHFHHPHVHSGCGCAPLGCLGCLLPLLGILFLAAAAIGGICWIF